MQMIDKPGQSESEIAPRPWWITPTIWILGAVSGLLVIASRQGIGQGYLDQAGKALYWTSAVFVTMLVINTKELALAAGKKWLALLLLVHLVFVVFAYKSLTSLSFITLTPLCFVEIVLFNIPFVRLNHQIK